MSASAAASLSIPQARDQRLLVRLAKEGRKVLRLKGGDPYVFGRGGEEALALVAREHPVPRLPGLTSGLRRPAAAGIPATMRGINKAIILATGHAATERRSPTGRHSPAPASRSSSIWA